MCDVRGCSRYKILRAFLLAVFFRISDPRQLANHDGPRNRHDLNNPARTNKQTCSTQTKQHRLVVVLNTLCVFINFPFWVLVGILALRRGGWEAGPFAARDFLRILNINVDGVRKKRRRLELSHILGEYGIDVCVVTGTHLRRRDPKRIKFKDYTMLGKFCRRTKGTIGGGVLILVKNTVTAEEVDPPLGPRSFVETCSVMVHPTERQETSIKITGVYITPKKTRKLTLEQLKKLSKTEMNIFSKERQQQLLVGDFNTTA